MGSTAHVVAVGPRRGALDRVRRRLESLERAWSRFVPGSEICRLNAAGGEPVRVSRETATLVARAVDGWRATGGLFDPTVLPAVEAAGYDDSFERLPPDRRARRPVAAPGCDGIIIDGMTIGMPPGTRFDPGGIGKGLAADLVVEEMLVAGEARGACVNIGGDLRASGEPPGDAWIVQIDDPFGRPPLGSVAVVEGAVATSSRMRRQWRMSGSQRHHLIDPRHGCAPGGIAAVSVVAGAGWWAEVLAKAAFVAPDGSGAAILGAAGAPALIVDDGGVVHAVAGIEGYLE